ncbi:coiled-coil domain-containing protein 172 isoform X2 [Notolabrus celidotus]|uniref:coiled-coil domain-containing protein 172 isoform X2 n=1 Tax=Notolabrus celidotus TaxID=1203425 RepID=UPI0014901154|nr:coiled-coil domain-containing protein 172 isoform X2 [Notolabrus celidotus]
MSLDSLFQQILLTEQQLTEQTQRFKEVKVAIIRCNEQIKSHTDNLERTKEERDQKAQQSSVMRLQRGLMKKHENQMLLKIEELLCQTNQLQQRLVTIKKESMEEKEKFLLEISRFNSDFSLGRSKEIQSESHTQTEILDLEREAESLYKEMKLMGHRNRHMNSMQEQKRVLQVKLHSLENSQKDLDRQLWEAEAVTGSLKAESLFVSQKPLTDSTCLRLRKELEMHKEGELELLREALSSEIQFLKSKMESSQGSEQH